MRMSACRSLAILTLVALAYPVCGQSPASPSNANFGTHEREPYTAEFKTTQVRMLPDGSTINHVTIEVVAVDSQGRRMTATRNVPSPADQAPETRFTVVDPVTHTSISWTSPGKEAAVSAIPIPAATQCSYAWASTGVFKIGPHGKVEYPSVKTAVEDLGTQAFQGVDARGRRTTTTTTPVGPLGKNQPLVNTFEVWRAVDPRLKGLLTLEVRDDPQSGKMTKTLVKFSEAEPNSSIFQSPPGYEIVNREVAMDWCPNEDDVEPAAVPPQ